MLLLTSHGVSVVHHSFGLVLGNTVLTYSLTVEQKIRVRKTYQLLFSPDGGMVVVILAAIKHVCHSSNASVYEYGGIYILEHFTHDIWFFLSVS